MPEPDVVGGAPAVDPGLPLDQQVRRAEVRSRRRRLAGVVGSVVLLATAGVLASREERAPQPTPAPDVTVVPAPPETQVVFVVGGQWAFGLVARCEDPGGSCTQVLVRRSAGGGGWTTGGLPAIPARSGSAWLYATGKDAVTVVDQPPLGTVFVSTDAGETFTARPLRPGPPAAAVPPNGILDIGLCDRCSRRLTVLEPTTGRFRPLATQPPLSDGQLRGAAMRDDVIWVVGVRSGQVVTAVSRDRGRRWRELLVRGLEPPLGAVQVVPTARGGAYLVVSWDELPDLGTEFSQLWEVARPGAAWTEVTPAERPRTARTVVAGDRGLLVCEETGGVWRLRSDGRMYRLPDPVADGVALRPAYLQTGAGRMLVTWPAAAVNRPVALVSFDEGESWQVEDLPR